MLPNGIKRTPWEQSCLGMETYELELISPDIYQFMKTNPGHYTIKIDPLHSKKSLHEYGFYYCDTLVEPFCLALEFRAYDHPKVSFCLADNLEKIMPLVINTFDYSRFSRDFNLTNEIGNKRYQQWLQQLFKKNSLYKLLFENKTAGFIAFDENRFLLHSLDKEFRGKGLAKFFWTPVCQYIFSKGNSEIISSISLANLNTLNLHSALGFRYRNVRDVYHCFIT